MNHLPKYSLEKRPFEQSAIQNNPFLLISETPLSTEQGGE
jgi:hypothetical protein